MVATSLATPHIQTDIKHAEKIAPIRKQEAARVAAVELERTLDVLDQLHGDDWTQPTDCTEWNVQDIAAHLAGACAGWATWKHFRRQLIANPHMRAAEVPVDAINQRQLEDRAGQTPPQHIEELRVMGPKAIRNRKRLPGPMRMIRIDAKPMPGKMSMAYLVDVIYPRDQWMHRMDICRATGKKLVVTPDHDGRLLDLVMLDIAKSLGGRLSLTVNVTGALNASYRFGEGEPQTELDIDFLTLNRRASMRITAETALDEVSIRGDAAVARAFVRDCEILY